MISYKHKFIFTHIPHVAGTSIDKVLEPLSDHKMKHIRLREAYALGRYKLDEYFSFCFVRNPWDRMVSYWGWWTQIVNRPLPLWCKTFVDFVHYAEDPSQKHYQYERKFFRSQLWWITDELSVVYPDLQIYRYENLKCDWDKVCYKLSMNLDLLHLYKTDRDRNYRNYYDDETISKVNKMFFEDIDYFKYEF